MSLSWKKNENLFYESAFLINVLGETYKPFYIFTHLSRNDKNSAEPKYSVNICYATPSLSSVCKVINTWHPVIVDQENSPDVDMEGELQDCHDEAGPDRVVVANDEHERERS